MSAAEKSRTGLPPPLVAAIVVFALFAGLHAGKINAEADAKREAPATGAASAPSEPAATFTVHRTVTLIDSGASGRAVIERALADEPVAREVLLAGLSADVLAQTWRPGERHDATYNVVVNGKRLSWQFFFHCVGRGGDGYSRAKPPVKETPL